MGTEQIAASCTGEPLTLSDADIETLLQTMPTADERERLFWAPRDIQHRRYGLCQRTRADSAFSVIEGHNETVRER